MTTTSSAGVAEFGVALPISTSKQYESKVLTALFAGSAPLNSIDFVSMARAEHLDRLSALELFRTCSKRDLQRVARASEEITVTAGTMLMEQGEAGTEAFVILEGEAIVRRGGRKIATLGPGDAAGELALLDRLPRSAYVEASTDMRLLRIKGPAFRTLLTETPSMALNLLAAMSMRVRDLDRRIYG